jgi:hypothetical protein
MLLDNAGLQGVIKELDVLPAFQEGLLVNDTNHLNDIKLDHPYTDSTKISVQFQYKGQTFTETAVSQFRKHITGFDPKFRQALSGMAGVKIDSQSRNIVFGPREHTIKSSLEFGKGWSVTFEAGSRLKLEKGTTLKIRGPLFLLGTEEAPVEVHVTPDPDFQGIGAWGGILVSQSEARSIVRHALLTGEGFTSIVNRQDYYGITGCISFYESDVDVVNSTFGNMHCEDALNIVRADFTIINSTIRGTAFDGFDSDFSEGVIRDSLFELTGNDAVDVSGTSLVLENVEFLKIGDKSISVGEDSTLNARGIVINGSSSGVASKDLSAAVVSDSSFRNITNSALITYIKKSEYGSASIDCNGCSFSNIGFLSTNQNGSHISLDGVVQPVTNFNKRQLLEAGFATNQ